MKIYICFLVCGLLPVIYIGGLCLWMELVNIIAEDKKWGTIKSIIVYMCGLLSFSILSFFIGITSYNQIIR